MARHYLDHASTSPPRPEVIAAWERWVDAAAADPGRVHEEGRTVRALVEDARDQLAGFLGVRSRQVIFTSGATEAINAAVWGATRSRPGGAVLCAQVEHSAVREASARLAPIKDLPVDRLGRLDPAAVAETMDPGDALVHCQWANHEVGTIQPAAEVAAIGRERGVRVHVDAAAACGHLPLDLGALDADLVSISAHKIGGPPGIGALIVRRGLRLEPLLLGGDQERARRAGMENVPAILGFGAVAEALSRNDRSALRAEAQAARDQIAVIEKACTAVDGVTVIGDPDPAGRLPSLICLGVEGVEAEPVLLGLDRAGIAGHSGSACATEALAPSPVLAAMGVDPSHSLRLSVGWSTTAEDVDALAEAFSPVVTSLRALRGTI